jgi:hypothetical protein
MEFVDMQDFYYYGNTIFTNATGSFGVVLPTESCLQELQEQFRRSLMVCTLCTNEFKHLKCSNFHWYEGKLQISR